MIKSQRAAKNVFDDNVAFFCTCYFSQCALMTGVAAFCWLRFGGRGQRSSSSSDNIFCMYIIMEIRDVLTTNKHTHIRVATKKGKSRPKLRLFFSAWSRNMAVGYNVCEKFQVNEKVLKKKTPECSLHTFSFAFRQCIHNMNKGHI